MKNSNKQTNKNPSNKPNTPKQPFSFWSTGTSTAWSLSNWRFTAWHQWCLQIGIGRRKIEELKDKYLTSPLAQIFSNSKRVSLLQILKWLFSSIQRDKAKISRTGKIKRWYFKEIIFSKNLIFHTALFQVFPVLSPFVSTCFVTFLVWCLLKLSKNTLLSSSWLFCFV